MPPKKQTNKRAQAAAVAAVAAVAAIAPAAVEAAVKAAAEDQEPTETYLVVHPVSHDNVHYKRESEIELAEDEARPLLDLGVVKPKPAAEETK
jgi:hypothetical protein